MRWLPLAEGDKEKALLTLLKRATRTLFKTIAIGARDWAQFQIEGWMGVYNQGQGEEVSGWKITRRHQA